MFLALLRWLACLPSDNCHLVTMLLMTILMVVLTMIILLAIVLVLVSTLPVLVDANKQCFAAEEMLFSPH